MLVRPRRRLLRNHQRCEAEADLRHRILRQRQSALPRRPPPGRQLLWRHPVPQRHIFHRRPGLQALVDDPPLHLRRPFPPAPRALPDLDPPCEAGTPAILEAVAFAHTKPLQTGGQSLTQHAPALKIENLWT
jgi:hypothetical protein